MNYTEAEMERYRAESPWALPDDPDEMIASTTAFHWAVLSYRFSDGVVHAIVQSLREGLEAVRRVMFQ